MDEGKEEKKDWKSATHWIGNSKINWKRRGKDKIKGTKWDKYELWQKSKQNVVEATAAIAKAQIKQKKKKEQKKATNLDVVFWWSTKHKSKIQSGKNRKLMWLTIGIVEKKTAH